MFALALHSLVRESPTFDEQGFLVRGLAYLRRENQQIRVGHPLGLNALNASLLANDPTVLLPTADPAFQGTSFHRPAELFLWEIGNDVGHVMLLARLPTVWLGLLLAALAGRWAWALTRNPWAGLLATALLALDPNILAHTRLTTTDLGLTAAAALAGYTLWRFLHRPGWANALLAGATFGLLQNTKFTAALFIPLFALVILVALAEQWRQQKRFPAGPLYQLLLAYPLAALLTLWATYGFDIGPLPTDLATLPQLAGRTLPLAHHLTQLLDIGGRVQQSTSAFLLGQYSQQGWWYYFPIVFLLKTPLPTLLLLGGALLRLRRCWAGRPRPYTDLAALLIPAGGFFAIALTTDINIGYRHILPVLPFLTIFTAASLNPRPRRLPQDRRPTAGQWRPALPWLLTGWLALATLWLAPHFLAYFNLLAGGPNNGWRALVDSNLDWGQDLAGLAAWQQANDPAPLWLSYFGEARPGYYGLNYNGLDSYPPRLMNPNARPFYPAGPAPGRYAISATNLQGVLFQDHDQFAWFRDRQPFAKIGYSIFLYDVPATGPTVHLALGGVQLDDIAPADYAQMGSNDIVPHWFDPAQALLLPGREPAWLVLNNPTTAAFAPLLAQLTPVPAQPLVPTSLRPDAAAILQAEIATWNQQPNTPFQQDDGQIRLLAAQLPPTATPGRDLTLQTAWQTSGSPRPVQIFIHLLDANGQIVSQWDGLGAPWEGWRSGDWLLLQHALPLPANLPAGTYHLTTGLYQPTTFARWHTPAGDDQRLLGQVTIP